MTDFQTVWSFGNVTPVTVKTNIPRKYRRDEVVRSFKSHMRAAHRKTVDESKRALKEAIRMTGSRATGTLLNSVTSNMVSSRASANMEFETEIGFKAPGSSYAYWANFGRAPGGYPPEAPILMWMRKKGISEDRVFFIRRAIGEYGTEGKHFMELAQPMMVKIAQANRDEAVRSFSNELRR
jgi:hypothetical protein